MTLGAGHSTLFANTGTTGRSTIALGTGSADIALGGASVTLNLLPQASTTGQVVALFNFVPGADQFAPGPVDRGALAG